MTSYTLVIKFDQAYPNKNLRELQHMLKGQGSYYHSQNSGQSISLKVDTTKQTQDICKCLINTLKGFEHTEVELLKTIKSANLSIQYSGGTISKFLKNLQYFTLYCGQQICFENNTQVEYLFSSMRTFMSNLKSFEILNDNKKDGYTTVIPQNFPSELSKLFTYSKMLKICKLNFGYMGWDRQRDRIIPPKFLEHLVQYCDQWPQTIENLEINLDRMTYENRNINSGQMQLFLTNLTKMLEKQTSLYQFSLNLSGFKPLDGNRNMSRQFIQLANALNGVEILSLEVQYLIYLFQIIQNNSQLPFKQKLGGHFPLSENEWRQFLSSISSIKKLEKLNLNIEFWKDFLNNPNTQRYHANIIQQFLEDLIKNHKDTLTNLSFNTDEWSYLNSVNHNKIINTISQIQNLSHLKLLFWKSLPLYTNDKIKQFEQEVKDGKIIKQNSKLQTSSSVHEQSTPVKSLIIEKPLVKQYSTKKIEINLSQDKQPQQKNKTPEKSKEQNIQQIVNPSPQGKSISQKQKEDLSLEQILKKYLFTE